MFPRSYFVDSVWPGRYFPHLVHGPYGGGYWPNAMFCGAYWPNSYFPKVSFADLFVSEVLVAQDAADLHVTWTAAPPVGMVYQLYANRVLMWTGPGLVATIPTPEHLSTINVGWVPVALEHVEFGAAVPGPLGTGDRATLAWTGGSYEGSDLAGFNVYGSTAPGGPVSYAAPLATVSASPGGVPQDGFGLGGFGLGGFGLSAGAFGWISGRLTSGTWSFGIKPFDTSGNEGAATETSVVILAAPLPPAPNPRANRLTYTYDPTGHTATLNWLSSPG